MAEKVSKKRKRQSDGVGSPSKKVAFGGLNSNPIQVRFSNEDGLQPAIVSSPGLTAPDVAFKAYAKPLPNSKDSGRPRPGTHDLLLQSSKHQRLDYAATTIGLEQNTSHYVAVFDPSTNRLQVTPAHHLSLRTTLRSEAKADEPEKKRRTLGQQRQDLGQQFGTKKAKKAIADRTVNAIVKDVNGKGKADAAQDAVLESMEDTAVAAQTEREQLEAILASKPLPKPNLDAENVEDVYTFDTLIPRADARLLTVKDWLEQAEAGEEMKLSHRVPANRVNSIATSGNTRRLQALRYLHILLQFNDALAKAGKDGKKVPKKEVLEQRLPDVAEGLRDSIRRRFANTYNELPKWNMDNLYTHICALALYVDGWSTCLLDLRGDLKMETNELVPYFRELGCKVTTLTDKERETHNPPLNKKQAAGTKMAKLKLPMDFPRPRVGRRK